MTTPAEQTLSSTNVTSTHSEPALSPTDEVDLIPEDFAYTSNSDATLLYFNDAISCIDFDAEPLPKQNENSAEVQQVLGFVEAETCNEAEEPKTTRTLLYANIEIDQHESPVLLDSGAAVGCMSEDTFLNLSDTMRSELKPNPKGKIYQSASGDVWRRAV